MIEFATWPLSNNAQVGFEDSFILRERTHYFFFVLSDCSLEFYNANPPSLDYKLHLLNSGSELPVGFMSCKILSPSLQLLLDLPGI